MRAAEIMTKPVYGVTGDASIEEAAALMMERGFTTLPVLTAGGHLRGVVTEADLGRARFVAGARGEATPEGGATAGLHARSVCEVMRDNPGTVTPDADLSEVAATMVDARQRCLPVTDADGRVVGIISWRDLLVHLVPGR
ncbi:CBS domain-containing protein [Amycolatopsis sp. K13G38]|uniref:CBS domain-containing protein n=1 Tax=Amycolatopsis acididurans TaxID=2724524 RepID=A0ABX1J0A0_9PSEU|nr:CBS domain-containing protein [Amycolatopsis acididurans]NKQ51790.1 CBS domain-containing protein [Amycolatopsis acididurans]